MKKLAEYFAESEQGSKRPVVGDTVDIHINEELAIEAGVLESTEDKLVLEYDERGISLLEALDLVEGFNPDSFEGENDDFNLGTLRYKAIVDDNGRVQVIHDSITVETGGPNSPEEFRELSDEDQIYALEAAQEHAEELWNERDDKYAHGESIENESAESKIKERIRELEAELETLEPGDYSYDVVNSELESLYSQLNESALVAVDKMPKRSQAEAMADADDRFMSLLNKLLGKEPKVSATPVKEDNLDEAEYQGREVKLGKPMRGDVAKYKVYVKDPKTGNVKKVNFGDKNMEIKRDDPKRRKSFRARHGCGTPKASDRTKARYWSCRMWSKKPVSKIV